MSSPELLRTPLCSWHQAHGARMVEFGGWSMPVQYGSIVEEHEAVRNGVGLFDISHMGRLGFGGPDAVGWIDLATTNATARLRPGRIQYSLLVNDAGGILDDILVYRLPTTMSMDDHPYMVVCNASNREAVLARFDFARRHLDAALSDQTTSTIMLAVQGPSAVEVVRRVVETDAPPDSMKYYACAPMRMQGADGLISRTGYTGEDGFELILPSDQAEAAWTTLLEAGREFNIRPCGLGARDTLRFEAGMPLYGHELDETINPYEAGLGWAVKLDKGDFLGREALQHFEAKPGRWRIGLALEGKRIARQGYTVTREGQPVGAVTSGTLAPTLGRSLAMALVDLSAAEPGTTLEVDLRGQPIPAVVVPLPFYRRDSMSG